MNDHFIEMREISKAFDGTLALNKVNFNCKKGEIHALVGENGAGKSTLAKILAGVYILNSGQIFIEGNKVNISNPNIAKRLGIGIVCQEPQLIPYLNVSENVFLGQEVYSKLNFINSKAIYSNTARLFNSIGIHFDTRSSVNKLSPSQQKMVEIVKCLASNASIIIMDEPTSSFDKYETEHLFNIIKSLKAKGITIIYISHRLEEVFEIASRVTVLKNGEFIGTRNCEEVDKPELIKMMTGRSANLLFPERAKFERREKILCVKGLSRKGILHDINFCIYSKEILGIAGLAGSGRTELARCIFGVDPIDKGEIFLKGKKVNINNSWVAKKHGMAFITEDRREEGLFEILSLKENATVTILHRVGRAKFFINTKVEEKETKKIIRKLDVRGASDILNPASTLSGGNQQKLVIGKWLAISPQIIIMDEPTRGIDVGAKVEIHNLMRDLCNKGVAIIMISSELPEVLGMSDRIIVMSEGRITGELAPDKANEAKILSFAHIS